MGLCAFPHIRGLQVFGCGQCFSCRIDRRRTWAARLELEAAKHADNCVAHLTYDEAHLPEGGSLDRRDYRLWLKRLRGLLSPQKIRFFLAGEYGETNWRPHYHCILFGVHAVVAGGRNLHGGLVAKAWTDRDGCSMGYTEVGELCPERINYVCGYVTKKTELVREEDYERRGIIPEFARMSLRPAIGTSAMEDVARVLQGHGGVGAVGGDVPFALVRGVRGLTLGRTLRRKLREALGLPAGTPDAALREWETEMRELLVVEGAKPEYAGLRGRERLAKILMDASAQKLLNKRARFKIRESVRAL